MPDRDDVREPDGPDEAALAIVARHALHDEELVAALAAGALDGDDEAAERSKAGALIDRCPACRAVHDDVAAIGSSLRAAATFSAKAPRDFRLSVEDAHRLGGTVITRGPLAAFGRLIAGIARPVGATVAALGLVGVLVGSAVLGAAGVGGRAGTTTGATQGGDSALSTADQPSAAAGLPSTAAPAAAPSSLEVAINPAATGAPKASEPDYEATTVGPDEAPAPTAWLLIVSVLAVVLGLGLFVYGTMAGRRAGTRTERP